MGAVVLLLAFIGFMVLFAYLKFPPAYAKKKIVATFDTMVIAVCAILCVTWVFYMRGEHLNTPQEKLWEPLAVVGALGIEIIFLGLCFVLRNFWRGH